MNLDLDVIDTGGPRSFGQGVIGRRDRQIVTDRQFEIGGVVSGEFILTGQCPNGYEHLRQVRIFYFDGQIGKAVQKGARFL